MQKTSLSPFLQPVFDEFVQPFVSAGFKYDAKEVATHGVREHQAIDFDVPRGTVVYAPADGYYVATYGEVLLLEEDKPRLLNIKTAKDGNFYNEDIKAPGENGAWPIWFGGLFIQGWHKNGMYTQYGHLDKVESSIPYYPPTAQGNNLLYSEMLKIDPRHYKKLEIAAFLKAGTPLGRTGMTGMGWGPRSYDFAVIDTEDRPDFSNTHYTYYNSPHLHFAVFGLRSKVSREPAEYYDPFGIYGTLHASYPKHPEEWSRLKNTLWLSTQGKNSQ